MRPIPKSAFRIPSKDRVCILGWTGSGKTSLAQALLVSKRNVIVVDTKRVEDFESVGYEVDQSSVYRCGIGRYIYKVEPDFLVDPTRPEKFMRWALAAKNRIIYVDELLGIIPVPALKILVTQGRASKVGAWFSTQRPSGVPLYTISEAQHFFIFHLRLKQDQERMENVTGSSIPWEYLRTHKHTFVYLDETGNLFGPAKLILRA